MRRVKFAVEIWDPKPCSETWEDKIGYFHQWAAGYYSSRGEIANYTYAIIEDENGKIWQVEPKLVTFLPDDVKEPIVKMA